MGRGNGERQRGEAKRGKREAKGRGNGREAKGRADKERGEASRMARGEQKKYTPWSEPKKTARSDLPTVPSSFSAE
jgi:hypothetical protein